MGRTSFSFAVVQCHRYHFLMMNPIRPCSTGSSLSGLMQIQTRCLYVFESFFKPNAQVKRRPKQDIRA